MTHRNSKPKPAAVYWITGLSASGKSSIASELAQLLREEGLPTVYLDGDELREVFGNDLGHTEADRRKSAKRNAQLCKHLSDQGITVVCATISLFHECQEWNRSHISLYREIFVAAPMEVLEKRDPKKIYRQAKQHIVGRDIEPEFPKNPDLTLNNDGSESPKALASRILVHFLKARKSA